MTLFLLVCAVLAFRMLPQILGAALAAIPLLIWCVVMLSVVVLAFRVVFG